MIKKRYTYSKELIKYFKITTRDDQNTYSYTIVWNVERC